MKRVIPSLVVVVVIVGFLSWFLSPVQVVKRTTNKLMKTLTLEEGSGSAARHLNTLTLANLVADEVLFEAPKVEEVNGELSRSDINSGFSYLTAQAKFTKFDVVEYHSVEVAGDVATVSATVEGVVELPSYRPADGMYEMRLTWEKAEDGWKLTGVRWTEGK